MMRFGTGHAAGLCAHTVSTQALISHHASAPCAAFRPGPDLTLASTYWLQPNPIWPNPGPDPDPGQPNLALA
jgi:hypothetical protein